MELKKMLKKKKKRLKVQPGKSIKSHDLDEASDIADPDECENNEDNENEIPKNNIGYIREEEWQYSNSNSNKAGQMPLDTAVNCGIKKQNYFLEK